MSPKKTAEGALCQCAAHFADGGAVKEPDLKVWDLPSLLRDYLRARAEAPEVETPEPTLAELREATRPSFRMPSSGKRPEPLNASRDSNIPLHLLRGWAAGTLGLPGDLEGLGRMFVPGISNEPFLPTSEAFQGVLPGAPETPAGRSATDLGSLFGGAGVTPLARGAKRTSKAIQGALNVAAANARAAGDLNVGLAGRQRGAIRTRGGNFDLGPPETWDGNWIPENLDRNDPVYQWQAKNLRNYIRRDLGAPTDPMLALEKELPGLHFANDDAWPTTQMEVDRLYRDRERGREFPYLLNPESSHVGSRQSQAATSYLDRHDELSKGAPLTRWGRAADSNVLPSTAGRDMIEEWIAKWPVPAMYPERIFFDDPDKIGSLVKHTDNILSRDTSATSSRAEKLRKYRAELDEALKSDWRAKTPDAETFSLLRSAPNDLGFSHMIDYLEAATAPYKRANFGQSILSPEELAVQRAEYVKDLLAGNTESWYMSPIRRQDIDSDLALARAGLLVDPETLGRMSVPDVARKTAAWNEYLANKTAADGPLSKGWKVHKEYPDQGGMKWVEFSHKDGDFFTPETLPEGYTISKIKNGNLPPGHMGEFTYAVVDKDGRMLERSRPQPTEQDALTEFTDLYRINPLREGLSAEGDAMGHCVGGYCDDVLNRGTKIYSLRDAKGQPHVTVEVAPGRRDFDTWAASAPEDLWQAYRGEFSEKFGREPEDFGAVRNDGEFFKFLKEKFAQSNFADPPNIVQIKGKGNAAPAEKYLPMVQDFVKSGQWGRVGDLQNTGLVEFKGGKTNIRDSGVGPAGREVYPFGARRVFENIEMPKGYMTAEEASQFLQAQGVPEDMANNHVGNFAGAFKRRGYAHGGRVRAAEPDAPKGFLPRNFEQWVEYAEELYANSANR